jgi:hypothetical protein
MVLIRYGDEKITKTVGTKTDRMVYLQDTIWTNNREAQMRGKQLDTAGYYILIDEKKFTNAPTEHVVWRSDTKRRGTKHSKKVESNRIKREREAAEK